MGSRKDDTQPKDVKMRDCVFVWYGIRAEANVQNERSTSESDGCPALPRYRTLIDGLLGLGEPRVISYSSIFVDTKNTA